MGYDNRSGKTCCTGDYRMNGDGLTDKNISGGYCTSDIWMNQIMNWMDDTDNQYDGIPVNWTAWNLHMSSSPKMLYSWDYKTTAYNGTHIKNRLLSYNTAPGKA